MIVGWFVWFSIYGTHPVQYPQVNICNADSAFCKDWSWKLSSIIIPSHRKIPAMYSYIFVNIRELLWLGQNLLKIVYSLGTVPFCGWGELLFLQKRAHVLSCLICPIWVLNWKLRLSNCPPCLLTQFPSLASSTFSAELTSLLSFLVQQSQTKLGLCADPIT